MHADDHRVDVVDCGWNRIGFAFRCADDGPVSSTHEFGRTATAHLPSVSTTTPPADPAVLPEQDGPRCS